MQKTLEQAVCAEICSSNGVKASEIALRLGVDRKSVNQVIYRSPLLQELCYQDRNYRWHGIVKQGRPHSGLLEFSGYYGLAADFLSLSEADFMEKLTEGCRNIGRSLSDTRGLLHSFRDSREVVAALFDDLCSMLGDQCLSWEIVFELRLKRARHVRIYADILIITENRVFSLEFKMKDRLDPSEIEQAAKYVPYLEILFGPAYEIIPVLVLTGASDLFSFESIGGRDMVLAVASGDALFNVFDEYLSFLS